MGADEVRIIRWSPGMDPIGPCVCAIGVFDGVHMGHRFLIERMVADATRRQVPSVVVTFDHDPEEILDGPDAFEKILSDADRIHMLADELGVDYVCVLPFDEKMAALQPDEFLYKVIGVMAAPAAIHVGCDFAFGYHASGHVKDIERWSDDNGCDCVAYALYCLAGAPVTSTRIRSMLAEGKVCEASMLLGHDHLLRGKVGYGRAQGRMFGFPTANVETDESYAQVQDGVYGGYVHVGGVSYPAAISVGTPPTFPDAPGHLECHLIGFEGDLYGDEIEVVFVVRLRDMMDFETDTELISTVNANIEWVRTHLS